jgi:DNA-3-methyladenine glycosylase I
MSYCDYVSQLPKDNIHRIYHDTAYGVSIESDDELFERLVLEINQAGLSCNTILNKQQNFKKAFNNFNIKKVAKYTDTDRARLLSDAGIIRNKLKVGAAIYNAGVIFSLQKEHGSFKQWLGMHKGQSKEEWVKLFKQTFRFTVGEIVGEFLMSTGYLPGAHVSSCRFYNKFKK